MTAWAEGEDLGWTGTSIFGVNVPQGHGFYGSNSDRSSAEDFASLDSSDGSVRVDGKIITLPGADPSDAQNGAVDDSKADVSSFKLDLNAVPAAVRENDFVDAVVQDYLKFLASGASDSDGAASGFWSDHLVALSFGLPPNGNPSRRRGAGCSSDGSEHSVFSCEYFEAVFANLAPDSGAAESGADNQNSANNNNTYNYNNFSNNFPGVGGAHGVAPGSSVLSGFDLVMTANPCGCEVTMIPAPTPASGVLPPQSYDSTGPGLPPGFGASPPPPQNNDPNPPTLGNGWPGQNTGPPAVPEAPTSALLLIGAAVLALALRRAKNPLPGPFRA